MESYKSPILDYVLMAGISIGGVMLVGTIAYAFALNSLNSARDNKRPRVENIYDNPNQNELDNLLFTRNGKNILDVFKA